MYYEKIKVIDLQAMTVNKITPNYTVDSYGFEESDGEGEKVHYAYGVNIIKTVEEVLKEKEEQQNATLITEMTKDEITEYLADIDCRLTMFELGL